MRLLLRSFPELLQDMLPQERLCQTIPSEFYARALSNLARTPQPMYRLSMQDLLLQQQLEQLDPDRRGLAVGIVVCIPPRTGGKVRSLRELGGLGTPPWPANLTARPLFLGAESLVGYAVQHLRPFVVNSKEEMTFLPARWTEFERSMAAFPILLRARVVGGLLVSSAQEFFFTETRLSILEGYAHLASCLFEQEEAFDPADIDLQIMPSTAQQRPYFQDCNQRVSQKFAELISEKRQVTVQEVRQLIWQEIEERLLQAPLQIEGSKK
jgi:GAF domain-containing protein